MAWYRELFPTSSGLVVKGEVGKSSMASESS